MVERSIIQDCLLQEMVGRDVLPVDIGKHAKLIKMAQSELATLDVLVCGRCQSVFHFIEAFKLHKQKPCIKQSLSVREANDSKPKIWAFLLWKSAQMKTTGKKDGVQQTPNSWALYQTWVKMEESVRETWVVAGKTIQAFNKAGKGALNKIPVKITKTIISSLQNADKRATLTNKNSQQMARTGIIMKQTPNTHNGVTLPTKTYITTRSQSATGQASGKGPILRARRTADPTTIVEEVMDRIVAKRFNLRRRINEYLVKWANPALANTWESMVNLEKVSHAVETFEKQLAQQKEMRAAASEAKLQNNQSNSIGDNNVTTISCGKSAITSNATIGNNNNIRNTAGVIGNRNVFGGGSVNVSSGGGSGGIVITNPSNTNNGKTIDNTKDGTLASTKLPNTSSTGSRTNAGDPIRTSNSPTSATINKIKVPYSTDKLPITTHRVVQSTIPEQKRSEVGITSSVQQQHADSSSTGSGSALKRKIDGSPSNEANKNLSITTTLEDLEEDLIPAHTVKKMKYGNAVSIEVKTKQVNVDKTKHLKVVSKQISRNNAKSAEIIYTQDNTSSGVVKKPGFNNWSEKTEAQIHILPRQDTSGLNTGIVRIDNNKTVKEVRPSKDTASTTVVSRTAIPSNVRTSTAQQTSGVLIQQQQNQQVQNSQQSPLPYIRTPAGTTIQRKTQPISTTANSMKSGTLPTVQSVSKPTRTSGQQKAAVTPEQKILQLSMSGDLKVTKKVIREDMLINHRNLVKGQQQARPQPQTTITQIPMPPQQLPVQQQRQLPQKSRQQPAVQLTPQVEVQKVPKTINTISTSTYPVNSSLGQNRPVTIATNSIGVTNDKNVLMNTSKVIVDLTADTAAATLTANKTNYDNDHDSDVILCEDIVNNSQKQDQQQHILVGNVDQSAEAKKDTTIQAQQLPVSVPAASSAQSQQQIFVQEQPTMQETYKSDDNLILSMDQLFNAEGTPIIVTGEDGTIYQVAGKNSEGQTILVTQGADGEQQFAYLTTSNENDCITLDAGLTESIAQLPVEQQADAIMAAAAAAVSARDNASYEVKTTNEDGSTELITMTEAELAQHQALLFQQQQQLQQQQQATQPVQQQLQPQEQQLQPQQEQQHQQPTPPAQHEQPKEITHIPPILPSSNNMTSPLTIQTSDGDYTETNIPAEVVQSEPPSPGGTRRVVLLLQDGTFMMTEMHDDEFKALNIAV